MKHTIMDTRNTNGDGANVFIKNDQLVVEITDDAGMSGGTWFMDLDMLIDEIQAYTVKQLKGRTEKMFRRLSQKNVL